MNLMKFYDSNIDYRKKFKVEFDTLYRKIYFIVEAFVETLDCYKKHGDYLDYIEIEIMDVSFFLEENNISLSRIDIDENIVNKVEIFNKVIEIVDKIITLENSFILSHVFENTSDFISKLTKVFVELYIYNLITDKNINDKFLTWMSLGKFEIFRQQFNRF